MHNKRLPCTHVVSVPVHVPSSWHNLLVLPLSIKPTSHAKSQFPGVEQLIIPLVGDGSGVQTSMQRNMVTIIHISLRV